MKRKVLHIVGAMDRGGVETWLMHVLRTIDRSAFSFHFLVHTNREADYDAEIRALGCEIHRFTHTRNPVRYASYFKSLVDEYGPFDVIHSHVYFYSGFLMQLAASAGIPVRIAHCHTTAEPTRLNPLRLFYERSMRSRILKYATHHFCVSRQSADAFFGNDSDRLVTVLPCAVDFIRLARRMDGDEAKRVLGIPAAQKVIGHIGRFTAVKNHRFLVEVFQRVISAGIDAHLLLVGGGELLPAIQRDVEARGLSGRCSFTGVQSDILPLLSAMDVFVFPSVREGLGIVNLEAQAVGVPVLASTGTPEEVIVIPHLVRRLPLREGASSWASAVIERLNCSERRRGDEALLLQNSIFSLPLCVNKLACVYASGDVEGLAA